MTDLSNILPTFSTASYAHLLPSLERHGLSTTDLITLDSATIAKRANLPVLDVRILCSDILKALQRDVGIAENVQGTQQSPIRKMGSEISKKWDAISTLDPRLDDLLGGGFPAGYITELTGESGSGKTQILLLLLLTAQLPTPHGLNRSTIYITTESSLPTPRLAQLRDTHPLLASTSLSRILTIHARDLETQEHILRFQLSLAIRRHNVGLVVIDSIAANFRAEFERGNDSGGAHGANMARRTAELVGLGALLRGIARSENVAVVVSNQVADRFTPLIRRDGPHDSWTRSQGRGEGLTLDGQMRFFTGWGDEESWAEGMKTPSLGLVWTNQVACRVAMGRGGGRRWMKVVFSAWGPGGREEVEIWEGGMRVVGERERDGAHKTEIVKVENVII